MKTFAINGEAVKASHLWKTHPVARGARRFTWIYRLCELVSENTDRTSKIRLVGLTSRPTKTVPTHELIDIETVNTKTLPLST